MSSVREFHDKAMRLAQLALVARHQGDLHQSETLARQAFELEAKAADLVPDESSSEPTRSILYRSAASLAIQCKEFETALRLIAKGLSGFPPKELRQELKDLYEQANFEHHLLIRDVILEDEDFQLSIAGNAVGSGTIIYSEFIRRIESAKSLLDRTIQRLMGRVYQRTGQVSHIYKPFITTLSVPRAGSFAITFRLARQQGQIPLFIDAPQVIDELLTGMEMLNNSREDALKERIPQEGYYRSFVSLTRDMAPDGDKVTFVGFSSLSRSISFTRQKYEIELTTKLDAVEGAGERKPINIVGLLDFASARKQKDIIGLTTENNIEYELLVQEGMDDYVKSYFKQWVRVRGTYDGKLIYPSDLQAVEG